MHVVVGSLVERFEDAKLAHNPVKDHNNVKLVPAQLLYTGDLIVNPNNEMPSHVVHAKVRPHSRGMRKLYMFGALRAEGYQRVWHGDVWCRMDAVGDAIYEMCQGIVDITLEADASCARIDGVTCGGCDPFYSMAAKWDKYTFESTPTFRVTAPY